jgi:hypothetical protein
LNHAHNYGLAEKNATRLCSSPKQGIYGYVKWLEEATGRMAQVACFPQ